MATINDIAKMAGVSAATVSHVVNNTRYVSPELREKVEKAIKDVDVLPNFVIRKRSRKHITDKNCPEFILFLVNGAQNPYRIELEKWLNNILAEKEQLLLTLDVGGKGKVELLEQMLLQNEKLLGIIISLDVCSGKEQEFLKKFDVPKVVIGNRIEGLDCARVMSSNFDGAYNATVHLIRSGHENIAMICGDSHSEANMDRIAGFLKALKDNGITIPDEYIATDAKTDSDVFGVMHNFLRCKEVPTAVFVANYKTVLSTFSYIEKNSIECPRDISVVGFNDFPYASLMNPPVTTIRQEMKGLCENAVQLLMEYIEKNREGKWDETKDGKRIIEVPTELCVRGSTCGIGRGPFGEKAADISELQLSEEDMQMCRKGNFKAAISFHYSGKSWMRLHEQGIRSVFDKLNISLIAITDANFDPELQNKQLQSLMMLEPDVLLSVPTDNKKTASTYKEIARTGMKQIFISNIPEGITREEYATCVSVNERSNGRNIGRGLGEYMRRTKKTKIGMLKHRADFYTTNQRDLAGEQILTEEYPELNICSVEYFDTEADAYEATMQMMRNHPEIAGIYVTWEGPAKYVMSALAELERQDVAVSTGDLEYNMALSMAKGGMIKAVSAQCPYEQGQALALSAANVLIGKQIPSYIGVEPIYVVKENLCKAWQKVYKEDVPERLAEILE